jgi:hypothetical protein
MNTSPPVLFRETQCWRNVWWVMVLVFGLAAVQWAIAISHWSGRPVGNNPAPDWIAYLFFILFGLGLPLLFLLMRLTVEVLPDRVRVTYWPLTRRDILFGDISAAEPITYNSLFEFGGWGIRGLGRRVAYNVRGGRGVELHLRDGRSVVLGSQQPDALAAAVIRAMGGSR